MPLYPGLATQSRDGYMSSEDKVKLDQFEIPPLSPGQVLMSLDGATITAETPLIGGDGNWMTNASGELLVIG